MIDCTPALYHNPPACEWCKRRGQRYIAGVSDFEFRFGGIARLFGADALARLRAAHVGVVGIGGVGSWAVEALARSGVGKLTLVDLDEVCVSNVNRQLHALNADVGRAKVEVMAERVRSINPECDAQSAMQFFTAETANALLSARYDFVIDAIDSLTNKCLLIARCRDAGIPVITCGGAGGRRDPAQVRVADLALTTHDRLLQKVREKLRQDFGFPRGEKQFRVPAVFSPEPQHFPAGDGTVCEQRPTKAGGGSLKLTCESGFGTATFVTGTFGFVAAAHVVQSIAAAVQNGNIETAGQLPNKR
jgi:tRNA threonylcarbamoyladenosine dehydratase